MSDLSANPDLDLSFLEEIADGSDEFIIESIDMFLQQTPLLMSEIGQGIEARNWPMAAAAAHKLKANLGFFGMLTSQGIMQQIESQAKSGSPDASINDNFSTVNGIMNANLRKLVQIRAEKGA